MNSVYEQCPKSDSGTVLSPNWPSAPCAQPQLSLRAQAAHRPCARGRVIACLAPCRRCPVGRIAAHRRRVAGPAAVSWLCAARTPVRCAAHKRPYCGHRAPCRGLASRPCRDIVACPALAPCHNISRCIAIQLSTASFPAIQPKPFKQLQS